MYDGITGLVKEPWEGTKEEGALGFAKGFAKGIGGVATKPCTGMFEICQSFEQDF